MGTIDVGRMIPKRRYRVTYQQGAKRLFYEGKYLGREVALEGDYLLFDHPKFGSQPFEIYVPSVREVKKADQS